MSKYILEMGSVDIFKFHKNVFFLLNQMTNVYIVVLHHFEDIVP